MCIAILLVDRFDDIQELRFQTAKHSDMSCAELQGGLFADAQESRFQGAKRTNIGRVSSNEVDLLMLKNLVFRVRNFQKCAMLSFKGGDLLMLRNRVLKLPNFQIVQFRFAYAQE